MTQTTAYSDQFFRNQRDISRSSAQVIIPLVLQLISPASVVDIGCGVGGWLKVFQEHGVSHIHGIDGDYVNRAMLVIAPEHFTAHDLRQPLAVSRGYDLAVSLEVAEHLPPENAAGFVKSLTQLAPVVLFSAAVPFQAGVDHRNEQWQDYWAALFRQQGYVAVDCIRRRVWNNEAVAFWYAQNTLLYVREDALASNPALQREHEQTHPEQLAIVHPQMFTDMGITRWWMVMKLLPFTIRRALNKRLARRQR